MWAEQAQGEIEFFWDSKIWREKTLPVFRCFAISFLLYLYHSALTLWQFAGQEYHQNPMSRRESTPVQESLYLPCILCLLFSPRLLHDLEVSLQVACVGSQICWVRLWSKVSWPGELWAECLAGITLSVQADFLVGPWEGRLSLLCTTGVGSKGWTMMVFITVFSTLQLNHLTEENSSNFYLDAMFPSPFMYLFCSLNSCSWSAYYMPGSETQHLRDSGPVSDGEINGYL